MYNPYSIDSDDFITELYENDLEELEDLDDRLFCDADEAWEEFISWAKDNPEESNYPLRSNFVTERAYKKAVQDWLEGASRAFMFS